MPNMRDIARLAGVSATSVSRALRGDPGVSAETRARIMEIAEDTHYHPNRALIESLMGRSRFIGISVPYFIDPHTSAILSGLARGLSEREFAMICLENHYDLALIESQMHLLIDMRVSGIIQIEAVLPPALLLTLRSHGIPLLAIGDRALPETDLITTHMRLLASTLLDYLLHLGHQAVAFLDVYNNPHHSPLGQTMSAEAHSRGCQVFTLYYHETAMTLDALMALNPRPTALVTRTGQMALEIMRLARQRHIAVPRELSVITCRNSLQSEYSSPTLTRIEEYPSVQGYHAALRLCDRITNPAQMDAPHGIETIPCRLFPGETCAPPRRAALRLTPASVPQAPASVPLRHLAFAFVTVLREGFARQVIYLEHRHGGCPDQPGYWGWTQQVVRDNAWYHDAHAIQLGCIDGAWLFLDPKATYQFFLSAAQRLGTAENVSLRRLLLALDDAKMIAVVEDHGSRSRTTAVRIGKHARRMIRLRRDALLEA